MQAEDTRELILNTIEKNPGLHFRELQRRSGTATGQLEYHLYQLERDNRIVSKQDGKLKRFFSNEQGTSYERNLLFHMRNRDSAKLISTLLQKDRTLGELAGRSENRRKLLEEKIRILEHDEIIQTFEDENNITLRIENRKKVLEILRNYRESFLDSMAINLLSLLE